MEIDKDNPWNVGKIEEFLYFCCPECDEKNQSRDAFLDHAFSRHSDKIKESAIYFSIKEEDVKYELGEINENEFENGDNSELFDDDYSTSEEIPYAPEISMTEYSAEDCNNDLEEVDNIYASSLKSHNGSEKSGKTKSLKKHMLSNHPAKKEHICQFCNHSFKSKASLCEHIINKHDSEDNPYRIFLCDICQKKYISEEALNGHKMRMHNIKKVFPCNVCDVKFDSSSELRTHEQTEDHQKAEKLKHPDGYKCHHCDVFYASQRSLKGHITEQHTEGQYKCKYCGKTFVQKKLMENHQKNMHEKPKKSEGNNKIFSCEFCGKSFTSNFGLRYHCKTQHEANKEILKCKYCGRDFVHRSSLMAHIRGIHEKSKSSVCEHCGQEFFYPGALKKHMDSVHLQKRSKPCPYCNKDFKHASTLSEHIKVIHQGIKDHVCQVCSKSFGSSSHLKRHLKHVHKKQDNSV